MCFIVVLRTMVILYGSSSCWAYVASAQLHCTDENSDNVRLWVERCPRSHSDDPKSPVLTRLHLMPT